MKTLDQRLASALHHRHPEKGTALENFVYTFELVPARASRSSMIDSTIGFAREAAQDGRLSALSITDNAGGHPALTPTSLGKEIKALGIEPVIHFSCKDKNRNLIESQLFELDRWGLNTLLVITGDYPRYGFQGRAKPVFDLDSVLVLRMIQEVRKGLTIERQAPGGGARLDPMHFHAGCVVSPFKKTEAEQVQQYLKLKRKIMAGARFIITQMGFDSEKYIELRMFLDMLGLNIPLLGTVFIPNAKLARIIHKGFIPGCTMPKRLLKIMEREAEGADGGASAMIQRAAKQVAVLIGAGYQGAHLSGPGLRYGQIRQIIDLAEQMYPEWKDIAREFMFPEEWGFSLFGPVRDASHAHRPDNYTKRISGLNIKAGKNNPKSRLSPGYLIGRAVHWMIFEPGGPFFGIASRILTSLKGRKTIRMVTWLEYFVKGILYDCYRCGDCYLSETELLCPQSQCAKRLVNGPCGGSSNGWCEVWPRERRCLYVRQYERLSARKIKAMLMQETKILSPRDWGLERTSSWINFFAGRDHHRYDSKKADKDVKRNP